MSFLTAVGIFLVFGVFVLAGLYAGKKVKGVSDFMTGGGKASGIIVSGVIMGSLVSSQTTMGSVQYAFEYGLAAWWFALGAGLGCLILALVYAKPFRDSGCDTLLQIISSEYGKSAEILSSALSTIGIFISILAQILACAGLMSAVFDFLPIQVSVLISAFFMLLYVFFGGAWGAGIGGIIKLILLYVISFVGMLFVLRQIDGVSGLVMDIHNFINTNGLYRINGLTDLTQVSNQYLNIFAGGKLKNISSGIALILGVISTQTYAQAIWSASSDKEAEKGGLISAFLIPPLGIAGVFIGAYARSCYITEAEVSALMSAGVNCQNIPVIKSTIMAFPAFLMDNFHPLFAGIALGTLFITSIGGGGGLSLGIATILEKDIYARFHKDELTLSKELFATKAILVIVLCAAGFVASTVPGSMINNLGFLSMGLRGSVVLVPMSAGLWLKDKVDKRFILLSIILSPMAVIFGKISKYKIDSLYLGIALSIILTAAGYISKKMNRIIAKITKK